MTDSPKRKLAAIMFTDMVGYTALMQQDEDKARELIERHRAHMKPFVEKYGGEIIQFVGDGTFCRFDSAIEAVRSAIEIQKVLELEPDINLRIGIHVGDVVVKGDEVYGDGVNVASRIEPLAEAGGICVSDKVYDNLKNQQGMKITPLGEKELKNVKELLKVYSIEAASADAAERPAESQFTEPKSAGNQTTNKLIYIASGAIFLIILFAWLFPVFESSEKSLEASGEIRSIAVLPLDNLSNDPDQEYFSDGMTEALIADIAKIRSLKVISRTSVMRYKGSDRPPLPEIARELGVDAILEGSVLHAEGDVRITVQLIRASTDEHLWAESYTDKLENIMMLQSRIARAVAGEIKLTLSPEEERNLSSKMKIDPKAHEAYLRGRYFWNLRTGDDIKKALAFFQNAVKIEPLYALAHVGIAESYGLINVYTNAPSKETYPKAKAAAQKALEIDPTLGEAHFSIATTFGEYYWDWDAAEMEFLKGLELSPNYATGHQWYAEYLSYTGRHNEAIKEIRIARELDPLSMILLFSESITYHWAGEIETARKIMDRNIELYPNFEAMYRRKAQLHFSEGEFDAAAQMMLKAAELQDYSPIKLEAMKEAVELSGFKGFIKVKNEYDMRQVYINPLTIAFNFYAMDDYERSLDWLERAVDERHFAVIYLNVETDFSNPAFRSNPRFQAILKKLNFPEVDSPS